MKNRVIGAKVSFQKVPRVEKPDMALDVAIKKAKKSLEGKHFKGAPVERRKKSEIERIIRIRDALLKYLERLVTGYPSLDSLPEFYDQLIRATLDYARLKKALGSLRFAQESLKRIAQEQIRKINQQEDAAMAARQGSAFLGRAASVLKQIGKNLMYLDQSRQVMRTYPSVDVESYTVAIAGFPNVGKSTLLSKLTTANPEIKNYAFTTKGLNVGTFEHKFSEIQLIDTPGTLARGKNKENIIELQARVARRYLARLVVYVFDVTEPYPLVDQERLLAEVRKEGKPVILYLSKTDVLPKEKVKEFLALRKGKDAEILTSSSAVKKKIIHYFNEWS